jgi:hypothetical protein
VSANLTTLSDILKEYYLGPVAEQLNNEVLLLNRLDARSEDLVGKRAYVPLHHGRSTGVGARAESAELPSAGKQDYDKAVYDLKYLYGRVEVTGPSMAKTKNEAGAFLQALKSELDGVRNDLKKDLARQVYGAGDGVIATVSSATGAISGADVTLTSSEALRKGQIYPGMKLDAYTASSTTKSNTSTIVVSSVNVDTGVITLAANASTYGLDAGDDLVRQGVTQVAAAEGNTYSLSDEVDGLRRIVADAATAFGGITPTGANSWWDNQRVDVAAENSGTLTFGLIQQGLNKARIAGGMPTAIITSLGVQREFYNLFANDVRYIDPESLNYAQGFSALSYNGMPVVADIDAPYGKMYILDESTMKVFSDQDWHFLDADGMTLRQVTNYDKFEAVMARYMNLGATRRNNQIVMTGIEVDGAADEGF